MTRNSPGSSRNTLVIISGPSGVGKTTVCERLLQNQELKRVVTCTTRARRKDEVDGRDYHFLDKEDFQRRIEAEEFLEYAEVHGDLYGTPKAGVDAALEEGKRPVLLIDVQGAEELRSGAEDGGFNVMTVFLSPPNLDVLRERLSRRGTESLEKIESRLRTAQQELNERSKFDHEVVNDDLESAVQTILELLAVPD